MKTLLNLCIGLLLTGAIKAQQIEPVPPTTGTWSDIRAAQKIDRVRQPPPMPMGGFWVVEDHIGRNSTTIIRYYSDQRQEIQVDTLPHKRVNIRKKSVVFWLNEQLRQALNAQAKPALAVHR